MNRESNYEKDFKPSSKLTEVSEDSFVRNHAHKGLKERFSLLKAFSCAWSGFAYVVKTQRNMKIHLIAALGAIALGLFLQIEGYSWAAVVLCITAVFAAECFNTALESVVDLVSPDYHELAKRAKDCSAAAVLVFSLAAIAVAFVVYIPAALRLFAA